MSEKSSEHHAGQAWGVLLFGAVVVGALTAVYFWVDARTIKPKILDRGFADRGHRMCPSCAAPRKVPGGIAI
jgi:hypothetical protein